MKDFELSTRLEVITNLILFLLEEGCQFQTCWVFERVAATILEIHILNRII